MDDIAYSESGVSVAEPDLVEAPAAASSALSHHLAQLPGGQWAIWRWIGLRSAGFPVEQLQGLDDPACAAAADAYLAADEQAQQTQQAALELLRQALDDATTEQRHAIVRAIQDLKKGKLPKATAVAQAEAALAMFGAARTALQQTRAELDQRFQATAVQTTRTIYAAARDGRFREALIWQNRHALQTGVNALLRIPPEASTRSSKQRQHEALILNYLHRYCTKNDTIGFFGPVGWATVGDAGPAVRVQPGPELLASRTVFFDGWGIDALAETLARNEELAPWFRPRRMPHVHVEGRTLYLPLVPPSRIPTAHAAVLRACDGQRTAKDLAAELLRDPANGLRSAAEVYDILRKLRALRRVVWTLEVPAEGLYPARYLRAQLEQIDDPALRDPALALLAELDAARLAVAEAVGDAERLDQAMAALETIFTERSGMAATRHAGKTYAGRTLVYEDCRRDVDVRFGPEFIATLGPPLALVLESARWFTAEAATVYRQAFKRIYEELAEKTGSRTVEFSSFWLWAQPLLFGDASELIAPLEQRLQARWSAVLALPPGQHRVAYTSAELRARVAQTFAVSKIGWQGARYHSPDVMIAAASDEAVRRGEYQCVLGELHPGANTLKTALFVGQHPAQSELLAAVEADLPPPQVVFVASREGGGPTLRLSTALMSPGDYRFVFAHDSCGVPPAQAVTPGAFVLEEAGSSLVLRTRDGRLRFDIIDTLGEFLVIQILHHFSMIASAQHTPRISIDQLVVAREAWRFKPAELSFAYGESELARWIEARRWWHSYDMPRYMFAHSTAEKKPFYVDFASPISVELFAKAIRRAAEHDPEQGRIKLSEMLPDPSQTWLTDRDGQHYTCELRIVAIDQQVR